MAHLWNKIVIDLKEAKYAGEWTKWKWNVKWWGWKGWPGYDDGAVCFCDVLWVKQKKVCLGNIKVVFMVTCFVSVFFFIFTIKSHWSVVRRITLSSVANQILNTQKYTSLYDSLVPRALEVSLFGCLSSSTFHVSTRVLFWAFRVCRVLPPLSIFCNLGNGLCFWMRFLVHCWLLRN